MMLLKLGQRTNEKYKDEGKGKNKDEGKGKV